MYLFNNTHTHVYLSLYEPDISLTNIIQGTVAIVTSDGRMIVVSLSHLHK